MWIHRLAGLWTLVVCALLSASALAQPATPAPTSPGIRAPVECTVAEVQAGTCSAELNGVRIVVTDGVDAFECGNVGDLGAGALENVCRWSTAADVWVLSDPPPDVMVKGTYDADADGIVDEALSAYSVHHITADGTGDEQTLTALHFLKRFDAFYANSFKLDMWFDPFDGIDATGDGSYDAPYRSLRYVKQECMSFPNMLCLVKGRGRAFSPRTLTVTFSAGAGFIIDELVTWTHPDGGPGGGKVVGASGDNLVVGIDDDGVDDPLLPSDPYVATNVWGTTPTAPEPRVGTVLTGLASGSVATVTAFEDTIVGLHSVLFDTTDITLHATNPAVFTVNSHGHPNNAGPFVWVNQTTMPTQTGVAVTEDTTQLYVCSVTTDTFQLSTSSSCTAARVVIDTGDAGAGLSQLTAYAAHKTPGAPILAAQSSFSPDCSGFRDRFCSVLDAEFPDSPWVIDGGGFYLNELRSVVVPERWPTLSGAGEYNSPIGFGIGVDYSAPKTPDLSQGWVGVANGVVQNLAMDGLATQHGAKVVFLNVKTKHIRGGHSDRSQAGLFAATGKNPAWQSHNSCIQVTGVADTPGNTGAVVYWINGGGSSNYQGSNASSGGCVNVNQEAILTIITRGVISSDSHPDDPNCGAGPPAGDPCQGPLIVNPLGELHVVGPMEFRLGPIGNRNMFVSGIGSGSYFHKVLFNARGVYGADNGSAADVFSFGALASPDIDYLILDEVTIKSAGPIQILTVAEAQPGSARYIIGKNLLLDGIDSTLEFMKVDSGASFCGGDCGDEDDAVQQTHVTLEGVIDHNDGGTEDKYYSSAATVSLGTRGTPNTWLGDIQAALDADALPSSQWRWFEDDSVESGGAGDGDQFAGDASLRCNKDEACWRSASGGTYNAVLKSVAFPEYVADDSCLLPGVLGVKLCDLDLTPTNKGAR